MDTGTIDGIKVSVTASKVGNSIRGSFTVGNEKTGFELADLVHEKSRFEYVGPVTIDRKRYYIAVPILITNFTESEAGNRMSFSGTFTSAGAPTEQTLIK